MLRLVPLVVLAGLFGSCPSEELNPGDGGKSFWAMNLENNEPYTLTADLLAEGAHCKVWVEKAAQGRLPPATAAYIAGKYDNHIYGIMTGAFDIGPFKVQNIEFKSIMEFADRLTDGDGKLTILMLDIQDGYTEKSGSYTAGYFYQADFFNKNIYHNSNETDMIYIDTYPTEPAGDDAMGTLAHEMQHLMNFATTLVLRRTDTKINQMDVWVDEGLSSAAEYVYKGAHVAQRYEWFNDDKQKTIARGNNFFVWGNLQGASILDDYATVYLFFQWLRIHSGDGAGIYREIIASEYSDYRAVIAAAKNNISWFNEGSSCKWKDIFEPWLAANYINAESGKYGYNNDPTLKDVKAKTAPAGTTSLQLLPGEAVYSRTSTGGTISDYASGSGTNITYAGLKKDGTVSSSYTYSGGALLTYNVSTSGNVKETGKLTGVAEEAASQTGVLLSRSPGIAGPESAVQIDARDMLARNGHTDWAEMFNGVEIFGKTAAAGSALTGAAGIR
ncbi:MAG: hypothetical protein LBF83_07430 [Spirochaetaceae bacterium]|nr:hypothetical protein [Spirochaetaceae bacterium]